MSASGTFPAREGDKGNYWADCDSRSFLWPTSQMLIVLPADWRRQGRERVRCVVMWRVTPALESGWIAVNPPATPRPDH